ncbi:MAG: hypothetical protein OHK0056_25600 [Bacteriovoracaceae bacterium]
MSTISKLKQFFGLKTSKIQTFTYYIPAPPERKFGYREKQFDKVFYEFINRGYKILDTKMTPHSGVNSSGMWVMFVVESTHPKAESLDLQFDSFMDDILPTTENQEVEGLYYIKNDEDFSNEN